ncbi:MAG: CHASE4 domain-containing protein [Anaerolineae bacterium]
MSLRQKTLFTVVTVTAGLIVVLYLVFSINLLNSYAQLERQEVEEETHRAVIALKNILEQLSRQNRDWGAWDDTYRFIEDRNEEYIRSNLDNAVFENLRLNLMLFVHASGRVVYGKMYDLENHREVPVPAAVYSLAADPAITHHTDTRAGQVGIVLLPDAPLLFSSWPIVDSFYRGPIRGTLLFGRFLTSGEVEQVTAFLGVPISVHRLDRPVPTDVQIARSTLTAETAVLVHPLGESQIAGYSLLYDVYGNPALIVQAKLPRTIYQQGRETLRYHFVSLLAIGLIFTFISAVLLEKSILSRLIRMSAEVTGIGTGKDFTRRVRVQGKDELSSLAAAINGMLDALQQAQREQAESEARYRIVVEQASEGIALIDPHAGRFVETNAAFRNILGYPEDELRQLTVYDLMEEGQTHLGQDIHRTMAEGAQFLGERTCRHKNGAPVMVEINANPIRYRGEEVLCLLVRDITERKRMEQYLIQTERIAAMGQLAAALAHEINNPLHSVWTALELVMDFPIEEAEKQEYLQAIRREIRRLMSISRRILDFARPSREGRVPLSIAEVIGHALDLVERELQSRRIQVRTDIPDDLPSVFGSREQLVQVFLNLFLNAKDAMPEGGLLEIAAHAEPTHMVVTVADTGPGIPPEIMAQIFEPFVTAKRDGTGLGLAISQGIIQQHGGTIAAANAPQGGAVFTVTLPLFSKGQSEVLESLL